MYVYVRDINIIFLKDTTNLKSKKMLLNNIHDII